MLDSNKISRIICFNKFETSSLAFLSIRKCLVIIIDSNPLIEISSFTRLKMNVSRISVLNLEFFSSNSLIGYDSIIITKINTNSIEIFSK